MGNVWDPPKKAKHDFLVIYQFLFVTIDILYIFRAGMLKVAMMTVIYIYYFYLNIIILLFEKKSIELQWFGKLEVNL